MKKHRLLGALIAGAMTVSGVPGAVAPLMMTAGAESLLPAPDGINAETTDTVIKLTWNEVEDADAYRVYMYDEDEGKFVKYKSVTSPKCTVKGLEKGTTYRFRVATLVKKSKGYKLQETSSGIKIKTRELPAPTGFTLSSDNKDIRLTWQEVEGAKGYRVFVLNSETGEYEFYKDNLNGTFADISLPGGKTYKFSVAALTYSEETGRYSIQSKSNPISIAVPEKPKLLAAPTGLSARMYPGFIQVVWNSIKGVKEYRIYVGNTFLRDSEGNYTDHITLDDTAFTLRTEDPGKYTFTVCAVVKKNGEYEEQEKATVTVEVPYSLGY